MDRTLYTFHGTSMLLLKTGNPCLGGHPGDPKRHRQELHKGRPGEHAVGV